MARKRIAVLVENVRDSGGNRVIFIRIAELASDPSNAVTVLVTARRIRTPKDVAGQLRDIVASKIKYRFAHKVLLQRGAVDFNDYDEVISTGRGPLEFVDQLEDRRHIHLIQHIESWAVLNSDAFRDFSRAVRYPTGQDCIDLIRNSGIAAETRYLGKLARIKRFQTVSPFLESIINGLANSHEVDTNEPPDISLVPTPSMAGRPFEQRDIDVLFFVRGLTFKGDALTIQVINALRGSPYRLALIAGRRTARLLADIDPAVEVETHNIPSDQVVADLYYRSKIVVQPSLCEGFGAIPREALAFGCHVVASRTGWLQSKSARPARLSVIERHDESLYVESIRHILR